MSELGLHTGWCRQHFSMMSVGGIWAVPRSGLIYTKRTEDPPTLELTMVMPWTEELAEAAAQGLDVPVDADALRAYQLADYDVIRRHFGQAGITVTGRELLSSDGASG